MRGALAQYLAKDDSQWTLSPQLLIYAGKFELAAHEKFVSKWFTNGQLLWIATAHDKSSKCVGSHTFDNSTIVPYIFTYARANSAPEYSQSFVYKILGEINTKMAVHRDIGMQE